VDPLVDPDFCGSVLAQRLHVGRQAGVHRYDMDDPLHLATGARAARGVSKLRARPRRPPSWTLAVAETVGYSGPLEEEGRQWAAARIEGGCASQRLFDRPDVVQAALVLVRSEK
jgi:hypothetical protein